MHNKVYKTLDNSAVVVIDTSEDLSSVALVDDDNLTITGLAVDGKEISFTVAEGDDNTEYTCIFRATKDDGNTLRVIQSIVVDEDLIEYYGSIYEGNRYFEDRLRASAWTNASNSDRRKALIEATILIDMLDFAGDKTDTNQTLQFPRNAETKIPDAVNFAAYEVAIILLTGTDPQQVANSFGLAKEEFETVRVTYGPTVPLHLKTGLMSAKALMYLYPYLREKAAINLKRVN